MKHIEFYEQVQKQMESQVEANSQTILDAAEACAKSIADKRVIHVFGTGHSQMFPMEVFYRAGGLVPVNALLTPHYSLSPKAKLSTNQERVEGFSNKYLELENTSSDDSMIVVSMSGRNASSVDMALEAKKIGMTVIAVTSLAFSNHVTSRHSSGKLLKDVADIIIDIKCVEGDAILSMDGLEPKFSGTSTVLGMLAMESIMARTIENLVDQGIEPPVYVSSNLDKGDDINKQLLDKYSPLISGL